MFVVVSAVLGMAVASVERVRNPLRALKKIPGAQIARRRTDLRHQQEESPDEGPPGLHPQLAVAIGQRRCNGR